MSQNEMDGEEVEVEVATETEDDQEVDTTSDDEITWEEIARLRKADESLKKANKKIAMLEKEKKSEKTETNSNLSEDALDALLEKRDFYKDNSQAKELREEIEAMVSASKGKVDRKKAFEMLSGDQEIEENRKVYAKSIVDGGKTGTSGFIPITMERYDSLSSAEQKAYNDKSKASKGGVVFK